MKQKLLRHPFFLLVFLFSNILFVSATPIPTTASGVKLDIRVFLRGALLGVNTNATLWMRDGLRSGGYLPLTEPYLHFHQRYGVSNGGETISSSMVLETTGANAIVDWVFVELRDSGNPAQVLATRSALLQRDGNVVDVDGESPLHFDSMETGKYYVAIRHRNHFATMTAKAYILGETPISLDFTDPGFETWGERGQQGYLGKMVLWAGDYNQDGKIIYLGPNNDIFTLFSSVLSAPGNTNYAANYIYYGYHNCDYNMDGKAIFLGPNNDRASLLYNTMGDCLIDLQPNCILEEQVPK